MNLVFDIGGTHMRFGFVTESQKLISTKIVETPKKADAGIEKILEFVGDTKVYKTVGAIAGVFEKDKAKIYKSPNLRGWENFNVKKSLESKLGCEVVLENDAALSGLGEAIYGAGRCFPIVAYLTVSTGVGGARIVNGKIDEKSYGFEPGSQIVGLSGSLIHGSKSKPVIANLSTSKVKRSLYTLEDLISGSSIKRIYGSDAEDIKDKEVWKEIIKYSAIGINNINVFWSPDVVVLGGGVSSNELFDLHVLREELERLDRKYPRLPVIRKSSLGDYSGIYGGIVMLGRI